MKLGVQQSWSWALDAVSILETLAITREKPEKNDQPGRCILDLGGISRLRINNNGGY